MTLKIRRKQFELSCKNAKIAYFLIMWYVLCAVLIGFLRTPKAIVYFGDLINIYLFLCALKKRGKDKFKVSIFSPLFWMIIFLAVGAFSAFANLESPINFLWGLRQNGRFFIFYYSCITFLKKKDTEFLLKIVKIVFWISFPLTILEAMFWVDSTAEGVIVGDLVGGLYFNLGNSVNAALDTVLLIYSTETTVRYFRKEKKLWQLMCVLSAGIVMAAMAELKIYIIQMTLIVIIAMLLNKISLRTISLVLLGGVALALTAFLFVEINARGRSYYTLEYISVTGFVNNVTRDTGYVGTGDFNRFGAVQGVFERIFNSSYLTGLFGVGLGNADYSQRSSLLQGPYYKTYGDLHYQWFLTSFIFIETGIMGLLSYFGIFLSSFLRRNRIEQHSFYKDFYIIMIIMMLILIIYNPSLRNEQCAFMLYMILAIPELRSQNTKNDKFG